MGIFTEADWHPFHEPEVEVVEEAHGGLSAEAWFEDGLHREYVRPVNRVPRGTFISDESAR